jgi:hypothetical protein
MSYDQCIHNFADDFQKGADTWAGRALASDGWSWEARRRLRECCEGVFGRIRQEGAGGPSDLGAIGKWRDMRMMTCGLATSPSTRLAVDRQCGILCIVYVNIVQILTSQSSTRHPRSSTHHHRALTPSSTSHPCALFARFSSLLRRSQLNTDELIEFQQPLPRSSAPDHSLQAIDVAAVRDKEVRCAWLFP